MLLVLAMMCSGKSCAGAQSIVPCPLVDYFVSVCCCCAVLLQLPGSAHDMAVQGYGFTYDYIDPSYPAAAKVRQLRHALLQLSPMIAPQFCPCRRLLLPCLTYALVT